MLPVSVRPEKRGRERMQYFKQFEKHITNNEYANFLTLWEEYCAGDEIEGEEMRHILELVRATSFAEPFGKYVDQGLLIWETLEKDAVSHAIFKLITDLQSSNDPKFADQIITYLEGKFPNAEDVDLKLKLVGLRDKRDFQGAVSNFELLCHLKPGNFVFHDSGWGVGEIMDVSFLREQISLEFDYVGGRKDLSFKNAFRTLIPISSEHFLARRFSDPDAFEAYAKEHPVDVIRMLLRDLGPKTAQEIKDELSELVIPEEEWTKWWQSVRSKLKKDPMIAIPETSRGDFELRDAEETPEDRLHKALEKKPTIDDLIHLIHNFLRDFPTSLRNAEFRKLLFERLSDTIASSELTDAQEVQLHFFLEDLSGDETYTGAREMVRRLPSVASTLETIDIVAFKKRVLQGVRESRDDWVELFLDLLLPTNASSLRDYIMQELLANGEEEAFTRKIDDLIAHPMHYPTALLWYFKHVMAKDGVPLSDQKGKDRLFEALLILLSELEHDMGKSRDLVKKIHTLITTGRFANVRKIFQDCDLETVHEFLLLASKCHTIEQHDQKILHSLATVVHPSLSSMRKDTEDEEEEIIWTTEAGYNKIKAHLEHIATVETVKNAKEIEIARSHGDLRENSEFKAAQEKRRTLQGEMKTISAQLKKARVLTKDEIDPSQVGVGTVISCEDGQGKAETLTLLGPWDADTEKNILSFQSKLAQSIEGLTVGEKFTMNHTEYTIKKIESYL